MHHWPYLISAALEQAFFFVALGASAATMLFSLLSLLAARRFYGLRGKSESPAQPDESFPPLTILKPIKGVDHEMRENLSSFLSQDYPRFQVLFALQNPEDPALEILNELRRDFPRTDMEIIVSNNRIGFNPKVNNLSNAASFIKHDAIMISDSDVRVPPDFLKRVVSPLQDPQVGMVTCFYRSAAGRGIAGILEALAVNAQFLPQTLLAGMMLNMQFAMGAVMLVRRGVFEAAGGFGALSGHLADDFTLGRRVLSRNSRIAFSDVLVDSVPSILSVREHLAHMTRWARTIRVCRPGGYAGLIALQGSALLTLYIMCFGPSAASCALWLATALIRIGSIAWMHGVYFKTRGLWAQLPWIAVADFLHFFTWLLGFSSQTVVWRGERYHTTLGGRLVPERRKAVVLAAN